MCYNRKMMIEDGKEYIDQVQDMIVEYTRRLGRDLSFQNIDEELKDPALKYTSPEGELLVAVDDEKDDGKKVIGMVAYHRLSASRCEMKRLYVDPSARGMKLGEKLAEAVIAHAKAAGFKEMVLDTITPLQAAIHLYNKLGFQECEPYYNNPMDDVVYMKKTL